jgi:hypothetical protein
MFREALVLVAVPMTASAMSTVITTTPLFAALTLILRRFAAVIFITMLVGLAYVFLFMTPLLAMFGPGPKRKKVITERTPLRVVVVDFLLQSKGVRFVGVAVVSVIVLVRPSRLLLISCHTYDTLPCKLLHFYSSCQICVVMHGEHI